MAVLSERYLIKRDERKGWKRANRRAERKNVSSG
jgi:hypothetical protein